MVTVMINGAAVEAAEHLNLLECALRAGIYIPHLCYHPDLVTSGICGLCVVEISRADGCDRQVLRACPVHAGRRNDRLHARARWHRLPSVGPGTDARRASRGLFDLPQLRPVRAAVDDPVHRGRARSAAGPVQGFRPRNQQSPVRLRSQSVRALRTLRSGLWRPARSQRRWHCSTPGRSGEPAQPAGLSLAQADCRYCGACVEVCPTGAIRDKERWSMSTSSGVPPWCPAVPPAPLEPTFPATCG